MSDKPEAMVREVNGQLVLEDPMAVAVAGVVERWNLYNADPAAVKRLELRAKEKGDFAVIVIDVDASWTDLADVLMPGHDWQQYRDRGEKPIGRGVVPRDALVDLVESVREKVVPDPFPAGVFTAVFGLGGVSVYEAKF